MKMRLNRGLVAGISILVSLILVEIILRIIPLPLSDRFFEPNNDFGWYHIPSRHGWQATTEFRIPIEINENGLRDLKREYEKESGVYRILLLGDSFTEGLQVSLKDTVGIQLQGMVNLESEREYEVINAGVSKFGTANELLFYENEGAKYNPDLVILLFFHNDVTDNVDVPFFYLEDGVLRQSYPKPIERITLMDRFHFWLYDHLQTYRLGYIVMKIVEGLLESTSSKDARSSNWVYQTGEVEELDYAWELTSSLISELKRSVAEDNARFLVVGIADWNSVTQAGADGDFDFDEVNRRLGEILEEQSIAYLDLTTEFTVQYAETGDSLFWPGDQHWNTKGHKLAAKLIYNYLLDIGYVD